MSVPRYGVSTQEQKEHRLLTEYNYQIKKLKTIFNRKNDN